MVRNTCFVFLGAGVFFGLIASQSELVVAQSDAVQIQAESQRRLSDGMVQADGNAVLTFGEITIQADAIVFDPASAGQRARARGNVIFKRGSDILKCSELRLDLKSGQGQFQLE